MISLAAFLVFLAASAVIGIYLYLVSRWIESEHRKARPPASELNPSAKPVKSARK